MSESLCLDDQIVEFVLDACSAGKILQAQPIQALWGGQGQLLRLYTDSVAHPQVVLKKIEPTPLSRHPRGWNTTASFLRKSESYQVECQWYEHYAYQCSERCTVARLVGLQRQQAQQLILLEDLGIRFPVLCSSPDMATLGVCLDWLAAFHAQFLHTPASGLWDEGCYWHLGTRADEYAAMQEGAVKEAAHALDDRLRGCKFRTLVHGDAKPANFCFSEDLAQVAAVDFQYVGGGCGMKDVVYLIGACVRDVVPEQVEAQLLDRYFASLAQGLSERGMAASVTAVETEWRSLYAIAWTDFYRFLLGWMPGHQKINTYTKVLASRALAQL